MASRPRRRHALAIGSVIVFAVVVTVVGLIGAGTIIPGFTKKAPPPTTADPLDRFLTAEAKAVSGAQQTLNVTVPDTSGHRAPTWPASPWREPLPSHEVVGFVPWYELSAVTAAGTAPASDFTQIVYHALTVESDGSLDETAGPDNGGYDDLTNGGAASLVSRGHAAGAQVLLGVATADESDIDTMCGNPVAAGRKLAAEVLPLLSRYGFDGVDVDVEGQATGDRGGFVRFMAAFSTALRAGGPRYVVMLNTYPDSAVDPTSFFDVSAIARYVNELFVMAYDMNDLQVPSATAPLQGVDVSDAATLATYAGAGLSSKVVLGVPFYGYDFTASQSKPGAVTVGSPEAVTYTSVAKIGRPARWDPVSETPYDVFRRDGRWHQTWFDDPVSIALKAALAAQFHAAGVGAWELGMAEGQPAMVEAMLGGSPPLRLPLVRG